MKWEPDKNNPIVDGDNLFGKAFRTEDSKIAKVGEKYYMAIASGKNGYSMDIYMLRADSLSGPWVKVQNDPIISRGKFYNFDYRYLRLGSINFYDGIWYLYYSGQNLLRQDAVGLAVTSEKDFPFGWKKYKRNPILKPKGIGWESRGILTLCLKRIGSQGKEWYGHYTGSGRDRKYHLGICYSSSPYGPFVSYPQNPILSPGKKNEWDSRGPARADFIKVENKIYGTYEGLSDESLRDPPADIIFQVGGYSGVSMEGPFTKIFVNKPFLSGLEVGLQFANPCLWSENGKIYLLAGRKASVDQTPPWRYVDLFTLMLE